MDSINTQPHILFDIHTFSTLVNGTWYLLEVAYERGMPPSSRVEAKKELKSDQSAAGCLNRHITSTQTSIYEYLQAINTKIGITIDKRSLEQKLSIKKKHTTICIPF